MSEHFAVVLPDGTLADSPSDLFMVWSRGYVSPITHETFQAAQDEATRLARTHPGKRFVLMKAVARFHVPKVRNTIPTADTSVT